MLRQRMRAPQGAGAHSRIRLSLSQAVSGCNYLKKKMKWLVLGILPMAGGDPDHIWAERWIIRLIPG